MSDITSLLNQGGSSPWLFIPTAILLGALHGLEPGHSKTMMAAFIIAVRGTITQAILLGLAATLSHSMIVWLVAMIGLRLGSQWDAHTSEPYFQLISAILITGVALWMIWRLRQDKIHSTTEHSHHHDDAVQVIDTGHGSMAELAIEESGQPPRFRLTFKRGNKIADIKNECSLETIRPDGSRQVFTLAHQGESYVSIEEIPEPHEFTARLSIHHGNHSHDYDVLYTEDGHHHHEGLDVGSDDYQDAHERAHANDIRKRFTNRSVTTGQIIIFGLTGGLIPCPAAITVLLLCLQLKKVTLGAVLVLSFSIGLAITLVASGVIAAMSMRYASKRWSGFGTFTRRAPYFSSIVIILVGLYVGFHGVMGIMKLH